MQSYTDQFKLLKSTDLPDYVDVFTFPEVYGNLRLKLNPYDEQGRLHAAAGHALTSVDKVEIAGTLTADYAFENGLTPNNDVVAVVETALATDEDVFATVTGKSINGVVLTRPDQILGNLLPDVNMDELRAFCQANGFIAAGVIDDPELTVQFTIDKIVQGMGLAWATDQVIIWPEIPEGSDGTITVKDDNVSCETAADNLVNRVTVNYKYDWATQKPFKSLIMEATDSEHVTLEATIDANWISDNKNAELLAERYLRWYAGTVWDVESSLDVAVGRPIDIKHPQIPITRAIVTSRNRNGIVAQGTSGYSGRVGIVRRSSGVDLNAYVETQLIENDDGFTYETRTPDGLLLTGATVTLDGKETRVSDNQGLVTFIAGPGSHQIVIKSSQFEDQTVSITL